MRDNQRNCGDSIYFPGSLVNPGVKSDRLWIRILCLVVEEERKVDCLHRLYHLMQV